MKDSKRDPPQGVLRIRKYANRRLYNPETSEFVTLADLAAMVRAGREFVVEDAKSGEDLTSSILIQIIAEQEAGGENLLPLGYLRELIGLYGRGMGTYLTEYLEQSLRTFVSGQRQVADQMQGLLGAAGSPIQDLAQRNLDAFRKSMESWAAVGLRGQKPPASPPSSATAKATEPGKTGELEVLQRELEALRHRVDELERR
jgi:polyhydroxyalkanoate synthesis repressor PhaR